MPRSVGVDHCAPGPSGCHGGSGPRRWRRPVPRRSPGPPPRGSRRPRPRPRPACRPRAGSHRGGVHRATCPPVRCPHGRRRCARCGARTRSGRRCPSSGPASDPTASTGRPGRTAPSGRPPRRRPRRPRSPRARGATGGAGPGAHGHHGVHLASGDHLHDALVAGPGLAGVGGAVVVRDDVDHVEPSFSGELPARCRLTLRGLGLLAGAVPAQSGVDDCSGLRHWCHGGHSRRTAIAVLIVAFLGIALWKGFDVMMNSATEKTRNQVEQIGN